MRIGFQLTAVREFGDEDEGRSETNSAETSMYINMSVNSSSLADIPPRPPDLPSNSTLHPVFKCFGSKTSIFVLSAFSIANILLLPVLMFILYLGYQQWRKPRSVSKATSHSDVITYHSIIMQLNEFLGFIFFCGGYINLPKMLLVGVSVLFVTSIGKALFHLLTCVERYLAVVHPIIYLELRQEGGVRMRNISIGCVWLLSFGSVALFHMVSYGFTLILYFCILIFFLIVISFFSIWVLYTLKRPGPGEVGGNREQVDQSKQRACRTIMAIMGVLLFRFGGDLIGNAICNPSVLRSCDNCLMFLSGLWFDLPSSFVLPLLFLHRAGKLTCRKQNTDSG